jgi:hypothetical protein
MREAARALDGVSDHLGEVPRRAGLRDAAPPRAFRAGELPGGSGRGAGATQEEPHA